ncbi:YjbQ family protein [Clostridium tanneri]
MCASYRSWSNNKLKLGSWQSIYFCEFDGQRTRVFYVKII